MYTILLGYEWFSPYFIFRQNSEAFAFCETSSFLRIVPFWIVCFVIFGIIFFRSTSKKPIFGNKKIDYYNTTFYKFVLPPFDKRYTKLFWTKEKIRNVLIKTTVMALLIIINNRIIIAGNRYLYLWFWRGYQQMGNYRFKDYKIRR